MTSYQKCSVHGSPQGLTQADGAAVLDAVADFVARHCPLPQVAAWDEAGAVPRELRGLAGQAGLLGLGYPEALGGTPAPVSLRTAVQVNLARATGSGGLLASLFSHNIGLPPLMAHGSDALQRTVVPAVLRGEHIAALAITEPGAGSDVAGLQTRAEREGDDWLITGEKVYITSGVRADWITVAARTTAHSGTGRRSQAGITLFMVPGQTPGLQRTALDKMGWWCSDTGHLRFDRVRVPDHYRVGEVGAGFAMIMRNFNGERLAMAAIALGLAQACCEEATAWCRQRTTFGVPLISHQAVRHKLVDMHMRLASTQAWLDTLARRADAGEDQPAAGTTAFSRWVAEVCLLKNHATQTLQQGADQAVQLLGGMGFMRGTVSERVYREVKVMMIGGGAEDIMKELAARQLGL
jgi:acyl-CoA dehydrogenase